MQPTSGMTGLSHDVLARLRDKLRREARPRPPFVPTADQKMRWLGSTTLRAPSAGHVDYVFLGRR